MSEGTCKNCGARLQKADFHEGSCPQCGTELRAGDLDEPMSDQQQADEASRDSFPASDPPAW